MKNILGTRMLVIQTSFLWASQYLRSLRNICIFRRSILLRSHLTEEDTAFLFCDRWRPGDRFKFTPIYFLEEGEIEVFYRICHKNGIHSPPIYK